MFMYSTLILISPKANKPAPGLYSKISGSLSLVLMGSPPIFCTVPSSFTSKVNVPLAVAVSERAATCPKMVRSPRLLSTVEPLRLYKSPTCNRLCAAYCWIFISGTELVVVTTLTKSMVPSNTFTSPP